MIKKIVITCYYIVGFIQSNYVYMYPETEQRLHNLCPSVAAHLVNGVNKEYDGVVETLMNRLQGQHDEDWDTCIEGKEEDMLLRTIGLSCDKIKP